VRALKVRVAEQVARHRLWAPGARVAVAVSGGRDSVCLLDLLAETAGLHRGALSVVTVDHGTRRESGEDAAFVLQLAAERGLPAVCHTASLGPGASEDDARRLRRAVFDALDVDVVALGHHLRDQVETALLGWMRGSGTRGHAGMAWRAGRYVRPLLEVEPAELAAWAEARGLTWREDPTNTDPRFLRNRVRHELLPLLESLRPGAVAAMGRGAALAAADDALLEALSVEAEPARGEGWPTTFVADGPEPLVRRVLLRAWPEATAGQIDAVLRAARRGSGVVGLSRCVCVVVDARVVRTVERSGEPGSVGTG
jgi:tRNA(Ile)-lysidine synthase